MKNILVTGLCTLHWGRLQYGNIGNYYIVEPLFRKLHEHFPEYEIKTTFQMDKGFVEQEKITVLPMDIYYSWAEQDVENAYRDVEIASKISNHETVKISSYIKEVLECEYIIDVSGDMWGNNAEHVGHKRFLVNCLKMKAAQILKKKTILYAVTPGPFQVSEKKLAKEVFENYNLVIVREKLSEQNLKQWGFDLKNVIWAPCPSFLFQCNQLYESEWTNYIYNSKKMGKSVIGITFGGFNMPCGPYDMWPRDRHQYDVYIDMAEYILKKLNCNILLFSHTNGFILPPNFKLINGRDYDILEQYYKILIERNPDYKNSVRIINEPLLPQNIKKVIGQMDMLITGRVHASVASVSQCVPTVYIEYDRRVIYSDKMLGFSEQFNMQNLVCHPDDLNMLIEKINYCYNNMENIKNKLRMKLPLIQKEANEIFEVIKKI
jgi:colanic acid/amylovoran biosynthesis protein